MDNLSTTSILIALGLTIFAGLSTGIGGLIVLFVTKPNPKVLSVSLGLSAGVMVYISFVELLSESNKLLVADYGTSTGSWLSLAAFFGGIFLIAIIDQLIPAHENPHEYSGSGSESVDYCGLKGDETFSGGCFYCINHCGPQLSRRYGHLCLRHSGFLAGNCGCNRSSHP